jgi:hypothetical protein
MIVTKLVVHHSASSRDKTTTAQITAWHKEKDYKTIGYHKVILGDGTIENGRSETEMGAHAKGANQGSLGVCLTGNFETETPTTAQINSLVTVLTNWCRAHKLNAPNIYGHYNVPGGTTATACPGKNLKSQLPQIKKRVRNNLPKYALETKIKDPAVRRILRKSLDDDGKLSFKDVHALIFSTFDGGRVDSQEVADLKMILDNSKSMDVRSRLLVRQFLRDPKAFMARNKALQKR